MVTDAILPLPSRDRVIGEGPFNREDWRSIRLEQVFFVMSCSCAFVLARGFRFLDTCFSIDLSSWPSALADCTEGAGSISCISSGVDGVGGTIGERGGCTC